MKNESSNMSTETKYRIRGQHSIRIAERHGVTLRAHANPIDAEDREVTIETAREIAREDAGLIYADVEAVGWTSGDGVGLHVEDYFRGGKYLGPDDDGVEPIWISAL